MISTFGTIQQRRPNTLLQRYCEHLGHVLDRQRTEMAINAAKISAELAARTATAAMIEAQSASRAKSEFLANMSHELRTPLNAIIGFAQVMAAEMLGPLGTAKYLEYSHDITSSAAHLLGLINDILDLARIEAGKLELHEDLLDVNQIVSACLTIVKDRAEKARLTIGIVGTDEPLLLWADERKMKQIVINLLSNAVKFTPAGGAVTIGWRHLPDGSCRIIVSDTGIGMAPEDLSRVLEPFAQADSDLNRRYEGTGLGLPLTRRLIELHGGTMILESELCSGTSVTVELPPDRVRRHPLLFPGGAREPFAHKGPIRRRDATPAAVGEPA